MAENDKKDEIDVDAMFAAMAEEAKKDGATIDLEPSEKPADGDTGFIAPGGDDDDESITLDPSELDAVLSEASETDLPTMGTGDAVTQDIDTDAKDDTADAIEVDIAAPDVKGLDIDPDGDIALTIDDIGTEVAGIHDAPAAENAEAGAGIDLAKIREIIDSAIDERMLASQKELERIMKEVAIEAVKVSTKSIVEYLKKNLK
ncbi:MAG: hypothetical protein HZC28_05770 [Spirochaetes bacterium]|nr:hypothetical protein [Spirochaetota bacterium]